MKIVSILSFLFLLPIFLYSQGSQFFYESINNFTDHKLVIDQEGDSIKIIEGNKIYHLNSNGQMSSIENLPFDFDSNSFGIFFYKKTEQKEIFALFTNTTNEVIIYNFIGNSRDLSVAGSWMGTYKAFHLADLLGGPGLIEKEDGNLVLIDRDYFQVIDGDNGSVLFETEGNANQTNHLLKIADGYLVPASIRPYISAIDENGALLWRKEYSGFDNFSQLLENEQGYFAIANISINHSNGSILLKLNQDLDTVWTKEYENYNFKKIIPTNDGGLAITGIKNTNIALLKLNQEGVIEWEQIYERGTGWDVVETKDSSFVIAAHDISRLHIIKTNKEEETNPITNKYFSNKAILDINNISNTFYADGTHADAGELNNGVRNDSTGEYISTFFSSGLWINGITANGDLHFSGVEFGSDFQGGLVGDNNPFYQQVWQVNRSEVQAFRENFAIGITKDEVPFNLLKYPAKGNPFSTDFNGNSFMIEKTLAPFVDIDRDSIYNPLNGDFPLMKGDKMLFWVMHDSTIHELSNGTELEVNVFCKAYAYHRPTLPTVNNTIFVEMEIVNESNNAYSSVNLGLYNDLDIGCSDDDYIGAYPSGNFFYAYNQSQVDNSCRGSDEFGEKIPIQTVLFLNKKLDKFQYFLRDDTAPNSGLSDPYNWFQYYNLLSGKFIDGTPLSVDGLGYNPSGNSVLTNYAFPGNPADNTTWTMCREELENLDVRGVGVSGPHELAPGEKLTLYVAHTFFPDVPHPCPDIEPLAKELEQLDNFHQTGFFGNTPIIATMDALSRPTEVEVINSSSRILQAPTTTSLQLYPIPANTSLNVVLESPEVTGEISYRMVNHLGQAVFYKTTNLENHQQDYFSIDVTPFQAGVYTFYALHEKKIIAVMAGI